MAAYIALLRGINVGRARRIAMAELRERLEALGFTQVRTVLNSGNVLFEAARSSPGRVASAIEACIRAQFGFEVPVIALEAATLDAIVAQNILSSPRVDPSRLLVAFVSGEAVLQRAGALLGQAWAPEALAVGQHAAYLHCPGGIIESKLGQAFARAAGDAATTRNWATVLKLQAAARQGQNLA